MSCELLSPLYETEPKSPGKLVIITGPTASGKSHAKSILEKMGIKRIISATTRTPRSGESPSVDYHFYESQDVFQADIKAGKFVEWNIYNGNYYGTPKSEIETLFEGKNLIHATEIEGAVRFPENILSAYQHAPDQAQILLSRTTLAFIGVDSLFTIRSRYFEREKRSGPVSVDARDTFRGRLKTDWTMWNQHRETFNNRVIINKTGEIKNTVDQLHALF